MLGEYDWDHINELADAYAAAYTKGDRMPELERKIVEACSDVGAKPPVFDDFTALLDTSLRNKDQVSRKIAWISQHAFGARAWCVGQKVIIGGKSRSYSPLVEQVKRLGIEALPVNFDAARQLADVQPFDVQTKIDALVVDLGKNTIYVVKGCSYSQVQRASKKLITSGRGENLFAPTDRLLANANVDRAAVAALIMAHYVLKTAFNHMIIRPVFMIVDDPEATWHFQSHEMDGVVMRDLRSAEFAVDDCPVVKSSLDFAGPLREDSDALALLPTWSGTDPLAGAPVDRSTRSLMLLNIAWRRQEGNDLELRPISAPAMSEAVSDRYGIVYPTDLRRHDLEDCLRAGGFLRRVRYAENSYAITPTGVLRMYLMKAKFFSRANPDIGLRALRHVQSQAKRWSDYRDGFSSK